MPEQLERPEFPEGVAYIWLWFCDLNSGRSFGEFGAHPLTYMDIKAWAELMSEAPAPFEIGVIKKLDKLFLETQ